MGNCLIKMATECGPCCKCCMPCVFNAYRCFVAPFEPSDFNPEADANKKIQGSLLVQIVRNTKQFPAPPSVFLAGPKKPLELKMLDPSIENDQHAALAQDEALTIFLLMLPENYNVNGYEIVVKFPTNPDGDVNGQCITKRIGVNDSHVVSSTITQYTERKDMVTWWPITDFDNTGVGMNPRKNSRGAVAPSPTAKQTTKSDDPLSKVRAAVSRYSMIPNQRFPFNNKKVIQDFNWTYHNTLTLNPYPDAINHVSEGDMWINWAGTQASKPVRIYSDGAVWARKVLELTWVANEKFRAKMSKADRQKVTDEYQRQLATLQAVAHPSPRSIEDLRNVVLFAKQNNLKVRVFGCNHSFAPICGTTEILVDGRCINTLPRVTGPHTDDEPVPVKNGCSDTPVEFSQYALWERYHLTLNPNDPLAAGFVGSTATATFSPGISTGDFERWIENATNESAPNGYKMPTSTVEDVFTMGGILSVGCHGTGMKFPTCSDWVVAMRFVDHDGEDVTISRTHVPLKYKLKLRELGKLPASEAADGPVTEDFWKAMQVNMGAFGVIYSYTMVVFPIVKSWIIMQHLPWRDYFDDTDEARKNLHTLQQGHDSCEFFYFPFMVPDDICGKRVTMIDTVYTWLTNHGNDVPSVTNMRMEPGSEPYTGPCIPFKTTDAQWYGIDLQYHVGSVLIAAGLKSAMTNANSAKSLPDIAALFSVYVPVGGWKKTGFLGCGTKAPVAYEVPHWRSNHPIDAIGAVENIKVVNIEYAIPINFNSPEGMAPANHAFGDIIRALNDAWNSKTLNEQATGEQACCGCVGNCFPCCRSPPADSDMSHYPVTVNCEMRLLQGSGAMLCAEYTDDKFKAGELHEWTVNGNEEKKYNGWALPELVSHSGNQGWNNFFTDMTHKFIKKFQVDGKSIVRFHQAKEFSALPDMLKHQRDTFRAQKYKSSNPWDRWLAIREAIDPDRMFLNPYLEQFLLDDAGSSYKPPSNLPMRPQGLMDECDDTLTIMKKLHPGAPSAASANGVSVFTLEGSQQVRIHQDLDDEKDNAA